MTEPQFIKDFTEATRDYNAEAYWINAWDTIEGSAGNSLWKIINDTIVEYAFRSLKAEGPSSRFPGFDSTRVHKLRMSAEKLELALMKQLGSPFTIRSRSLTDSIAQSQVPANEVYYAEWVYADGIVAITLSGEISTGNMINAPATVSVKKSQSYELQIRVTKKGNYPARKFMVGKREEELYSSYPRIQRKTSPVGHVYFLNDPEISQNAKWRIVFSNGWMTNLNYDAVTGMQYGDASAEIAYNTVRYRAETLLAEGMRSMGKPDSIIDSIPDLFVMHDLSNRYSVAYLSSAWRTPSGWVYLYLEELGGGKEEAARFSVRVTYYREQ